MIIMVEQKPVNVGVQVLFCFIPFLWIYGFYRIEKLRMAIVLGFVTALPMIGLQIVFPFPYGVGLSYILAFAIPIYFIVRWSREWNELVLSGEQENEKSIDSKSPQSILQERSIKFIYSEENTFYYA